MNRKAWVDGRMHLDSNQLDPTLGMAIMGVMDQMERSLFQNVDLAVEPGESKPVRSALEPLPRACENLRQHMYDQGVKTIRIEVTP